MGLQTVWIMAKAFNLALKDELMEKTPRVFSVNQRLIPSFNTMSDR